MKTPGKPRKSDPLSEGIDKKKKGQDSFDEFDDDMDFDSFADFDELNDYDDDDDDY